MVYLLCADKKHECSADLSLKIGSGQNIRAWKLQTSKPFFNLLKGVLYVVRNPR